MQLQKISIYCFVVAAVISLLDAIFPVTADMQSLKAIVLVFLGIALGIVVFQQEKDFLRIGVALLVGGFVFLYFIQPYLFLYALSSALSNFLLFLSSMIITLGLRRLAELLSEPEKETETTAEELSALKKLSVHDLQTMTFDRVWSMVILFAVALSFITLLASTFYNLSGFEQLISAIDVFITIVFLADLVILYQDSKGFKDFVRHNMFDILAAVPAQGFLRILKIVRVLRIIKLIRNSARLTKLMKLYKTAKFFSDRSSFNYYLLKHPDVDGASVHCEVRPSKKKTTRKKSTRKVSKKTSSRKKTTKRKK